MRARLLLLVASAWCAAAAAETLTGKVVGIADGDTVTVLVDGHKQVKVRLHGVDCPERGQPFGNRAKQFTSEMCFGKSVTVRVPTRTNTAARLARSPQPMGPTSTSRWSKMAWAGGMKNTPLETCGSATLNSRPEPQREGYGLSEEQSHRGSTAVGIERTVPVPALPRRI